MERRHLTADEMQRAVGMLQAGRNQSQVSRNFGVNRSVICRLWQRYNSTGDPAEQHPGRGRSTTTRQDRYIQLTARRQPMLTAREIGLRLQNSSGVVVSPQTVRNRLHEYGLRARRPIRCPPIRHGNRARRNEWCREHITWTQEQWDKILFCDESRFGFRPDTRRIRVYRRPGNIERLRCVQEVHPYSGSTVMVWAGIMKNRRTELVFVNGNMNAANYVEDVLRPYVRPFAQTLGSDFTLMHDNARSHTALRTSEYLAMENIRVLPWPAQSPDLNPIEHAWDMLQRRVLKELDGVTTTQQLMDLLKFHWEQLPQENINKLIDSMNNRCRQVLNNRGGHTLY